MQVPHRPIGLESPDLTSARRDRDLEHLEAGHVVDVLVIGGGITGCGVALDAASRGLDVALVEAHDLAFGTSRWSSKLVHGGLRYLAHGDIAVAWESAVERGYLMSRIAPHLIRPLPHVMPWGADLRERSLVRMGLAAADVLRMVARTPRGTLGRSRTLDTATALQLIPALNPSGVAGATAHWDGQLVDDARLVVAVARTAARYGARIVTRTPALDVSGAGARVRDDHGRSIDIHARNVIVATGVWTSVLDPQTHLTASRGSHVLLTPESLGHPRAALTVPVPGERSRYVFALPTREGFVIAGITDDEVSGALPDVPTAPDSDVTWILEHLSRALARPLTMADVIGTYAGLRPLVSTPGAPSADISRRHLVERRPEGHVVVTGGKLTTYRRMAEDAVNALGLGIPSVTTSLPLVGAQSRRTPVPAGMPRRLVERYGAEAPRVLAHAAGDRALTEPVASGVPTLGVEIVHAVRCEGARDVEDVVERRTRIALVPAHLERAGPRVAEIVESCR